MQILPPVLRIAEGAVVGEILTEGPRAGLSGIMFGSLHRRPFTRHLRPDPRTWKTRMRDRQASDVLTYTLVRATLLAALVVDASVSPREHFVSSPFAVPILIATYRLPPRGVFITTALSLVLATFAAFNDLAPLVPAAFHLFGLALVGYLAVLVGQQRRTAAIRARDAEIERARVQTILESATNAILYIDASTGKVTANREAAHVFGRPIVSDQGYEQIASQICYPDGRAVPFDQLGAQRALRGERSNQEELLIVQPDGRKVPVLQNAAPVLGPDGSIVGAVTVYQDISIIKEAARLREEWTSVIAHDLRQPITIISAYASLLGKKIAESPRPEEQKYIEHVIVAARNLNKMVGDLLDVSRIEARRLKLECQVVDLPALIRSVVDRTAEQMEGHPVHVNVVDGIPPVEADPGRIEQVLANLLSNASKYSYPGTDIVVSVRPGNGNVEVSVLNRGPGISPEEMPRLFSRFYRTRAARITHAEGLGLGLYISKGLVEAHGGHIWAESIPGQTTTFHFTLPLTPTGQG